MSDRMIEERRVGLRITLRAAPSPLRLAVREAGLDEDRVDVTPPMDEDDEADGSIDLHSLVELADILREIKPGDVKDACLWVCAGDPRSDPVWCDVGLSGGGTSLRCLGVPSQEPRDATIRVRMDMLAGEVAKRIDRARKILAGRED